MRVSPTDESARWAGERNNATAEPDWSVVENKALDERVQRRPLAESGEGAQRKVGVIRLREAQCYVICVK